jgi:hypothetical protein
MEAVNWGWVIAGFSLLWAVASFVWMRHINSQGVNKAEIDKLESQIVSMENKFTKLETTVSGLPTKDMLHRIDRELVAVTQALKPISEAVARIDDFFMTQKRSPRR